MNPAQKIIPDIELDLPEGWVWHQRDQSPLGLMPATGEGALQISAPQGAQSWRDYPDPESLIRQFVAGARLGDVLRVEIGEMPYGCFVSAECISERNGDACVWLAYPTTHDPLCITWLGETPSEAGRVARTLVRSIRPGIFSCAIAATVTTVRNALAAGHSITPVTCLFCPQAREVVAVDLSSFDEEHLHVEAIRHERARMNAAVVTREGLAEVVSRGRRPERLAFVYAESLSRRKRFLLPLSSRGREIYEVEADGLPISGFFAPPDEGIARVLNAARGKS